MTNTFKKLPTLSYFLLFLKTDQLLSENKKWAFSENYSGIQGLHRTEISIKYNTSLCCGGGWVHKKHFTSIFGGAITTNDLQIYLIHQYYFSKKKHIITLKFITKASLLDVFYIGVFVSIGAKRLQTGICFILAPIEDIYQDQRIELHINQGVNLHINEV